MVCPLFPLVAVGTALGGTHTVLIQDRARRLVAWSTLLALSGAWALHATVLPATAVRVTLEVLSVLAVLAGTWRAWWLARHRGLRSPLVTLLLPAGRLLAPYLVSPAILAANVWLAAMLVMEWRGKAHFGTLEYALVCLVLLAAIGARAWSGHRAQRQPRRMHALESFAGTASAAACPLGFGHGEAGTTAPGAGRLAHAHEHHAMRPPGTGA